MNHLRHAWQLMTAHARRVVEAVRRWWRSHRERVSGESGYAEAFTAVLLAAVQLVTDSHRIRYLTHELVAAYVAVLRALSHPRYRWEDA